LRQLLLAETATPQRDRTVPLSGKKLAGSDVIKHQISLRSFQHHPDQESGIGKWTDDDISASAEGRRRRQIDRIAVRVGAPGTVGRFSGATAADSNSTCVSDTGCGSSTWNHMPASCGPPVGRVVAPSSEDKVAYGGYLAGLVARCMDCHTEHHDGAAAEPGTGGKAFYGPWAFQSRPT
jgi:hypothetical protein